MNIPKHTLPGFICLDLEHPLVAWECYRGTLISAYVDASNNIQNTSLRIANLIRGSNINLANELLFEHVRKNYFQAAVSRMSCLYAFENKISAKSICESESWGGGHFHINNLVDVGIGANNITKVDANWITCADREKNGLIKQSYIPCIHNYWSGIVYPNKTPQ